MSNLASPVSNDSPRKTKKSKKITFVFNRNLFYLASIIVVLVAVFFLGSAWGENKQKQVNTKTASGSSDSSRTNSSDRWTSVGTIIEVSDTKIKIKDSRDQEKEVAIDKETKIVNRQGKSITAKDLKKDQRVVVNGEKDDKDKLTAIRIRLQE